MRWDQGRASIDRMLAAAELQRVPPSRDQADSLIAQARIHLTSATSICDQDPPGAYALVYDAACKALTAVLESQGLRPTTRGGRMAAYDAVRAQLEPPLSKILRPFDRMRRQRHDPEYPPASAPPLTADDVREDIPKATEIITLSERVLDQMSPY